MAIKHSNFQATEYVMVVKKGKVVKKGLGLSLFFNNATTSLKVVPTTAFDSSYIFDDIMTSDFQKLTIQGDVSYIISNYEVASEMVDFSFLNRKDYMEKILESQSKFGKRLTGIVKAEIARFMSVKDIRTAIQSQNELAMELNERIKDNTYIKEFGLNIINISVLGILPQPETRKALEAATREEILKQQDDAIYRRRNFAIEQERMIKENELNTEIAVVEKEREKDEKAIEAKILLQEKNAKAKMQELDDLNAFKLAEIKGHMESDQAEHARNMERRRNDQEEQKIANETLRRNADTKAYEHEVLLSALAKADKDIITAIVHSGMDSERLIAKAFDDLAKNSGKN